jgi:hypothetical protein
MKSLLVVALVAVLALLSPARPAFSTAVQINSGNTSLLFGGTDAEGGIGDWYVSNGVIEAIIDNVGLAPDLVGVLTAPDVAPPIQAEINPTGGTLIDLGLVGQNNDQLAQFFTVGGLSTSNFILYDTVSAPTADTIRATGKVLFPTVSVTPCIDIVTDYTAGGSDPFLTITTTATNNCGVSAGEFGGYLDVFIWTIRGIIPFSAGAAPTGGKGFDHPVLNLSNPALALEFPTFLGGPGLVRPADGIMDPANGTTCGEVSYGLVPESVTLDSDGPGGPNPPVTTAVDSLFGVSSTLVSALGNNPIAPPDPDGTLTYVRRIYVGNRGDVRSVSDGIVPELASRLGWGSGTVSGDVDAADAANVEASILITRLGRCSGNPSISCKTNPVCTGMGTCTDPVPTTGFSPNGAVTQIRTDATGAFSAVALPAGDYELKVSSQERDDVIVSPVTVTASTNTPVTVPALSARGTVTFTVREKKSGTPLIPAKLTFKGVNPTADPRFHRDLAAKLGPSDIGPESFGGTQAGTTGHAAAQGNVVYTATGTGDIQIRPGTYDVYVSRGMEYNVQRRTITVASGGSVPVDVLLKRSLKTKGAISADFHVHSGRSLDASAPLRDRVAAFGAEGVEVMVSTDHDKNLDYTSIIAAFPGLPALLRSVVGTELTGSVPNPPNFPASYGHINAWPLVVAANEPRDGAIEEEYVAPNWIYKRLRDAGAEVIQYNHPRAGVSGLTTIGIFNNIGCNRCANSIDMPCVVDTDCPASPAPRDCTCVGYQPDRPIGMAPNDILLDDKILGPSAVTVNPDGLTNLDFDVMEIANGAKDSDVKGYRQVRRDWLSLLNQAIFKPVTGVSDSHRITVEHAGWARSYVFGAGDDPAALDVATMDNNVKAGNLVSAAGPYIEFSTRTTSGKTGLGGLAGSTDGNVRLKIRVRSAAWIPVEEVRIIANGFVVASFDGTTSPKVKAVPSDFQSAGKTSRFRANVTMSIAQDTYFIVEAGAKFPADINTPPTPPAIVDIVEPDVVPLSVTNPIFVDRNGNATFDAPGLPVMMASSTSTELPAFARVRMEVPDDEGIWTKLWTGITRYASRLRGVAVAEEAPGEMTGVTKEQKAEAVRKGEYFPLHQFSIPRQAAEQMRRQQEAAQQGSAPAGSGAPTGER